MDDEAKLHRAARVFLARLLIVYGTDAPEQLRRVADELEGLATALDAKAPETSRTSRTRSRERPTGARTREGN